MEVKQNPKKFKIVFRGYDVDEVNDYIENRTEKYEETLAEQKSRIFELVEINKRLCDELSSLSKQEKNLSQALLQANEKADQIITNARLLADAEMERVRVFQEKWEFFAKKMLAELSPKELMYYERMKDRIDSTFKQFAAQTAETKRSYPHEAMKRVAAADTSQQINPIKRVTSALDSKPAIGLDEVYSTDESLSDLLDELL